MKMENNDQGSRTTWRIGAMDTYWSDDSSGTNRHSSPSALFKCKSPGGSESSRCGSNKHSFHPGMFGTCDSSSREKLSPYGESKKPNAHCSTFSPEDFGSHKKVKKVEVENCDVSGPTKREARLEGKSYAEALADSVTSGSRDLVKEMERKKRGSSGSQTFVDSPSSECQEDPSENLSTFGENLSSDSFLYSTAFDYTPGKAFDTPEKVSAQVLDRDGTEFDFDVEVFSGDEADPKKPGSSPLFTETPVKAAGEADSDTYGSSYGPEARLFSPSFGNSVNDTGGLSSSEFGMKPRHSTPENYSNANPNSFASSRFDDIAVNFGTPEMSRGCVWDSFGNQSLLSESSHSSDSQRFYKKSEVEENAEDSREFSYLDKMTSDSVSSIGVGGYRKSMSYEDKTPSDDIDGESCIGVAFPNAHTNTEYSEIVGPRPENAKITDLREQPSKGKSPSEIKRETREAQLKYINSLINPSRARSEGRKEGTRELNQTFPGTKLRSYFRTEQSTPLSGRDHNFRRFKRNLSFEKKSPVSSRSHERWLDEKRDVSPKCSSGKLEWKPIPSSRQSDEGIVIRRATMPPQSEALITEEFTPGFIDTHCHLDFLFTRSYHSGTLKTYRLKCKDQEAFPKSFEGCVAVFCEPWTFRKISWWEEIISESNIWAAFGCHPHYVSKFTDQEEVYLTYALRNAKVVALGEIGLDYSDRNNEDRDLQQEVFRKQLKIALECKKPIVIHCRDAHRDCITILKQEVPKDHLIHRHCFTDSLEDAEEWMSAFSNVYLGFTGLVTLMNRRARMVRNVLRHIPLDRILLETDTPYFRPFTPGLSHPGMAIHVAAEIATVKGMDLQEVLKRTRENTTKMYGI